MTDSIAQWADGQNGNGNRPQTPAPQVQMPPRPQQYQQPQYPQQYQQAVYPQQYQQPQYPQQYQRRSPEQAPTPAYDMDQVKVWGSAFGVALVLLLIGFVLGSIYERTSLNSSLLQQMEQFYEQRQ